MRWLLHIADLSLLGSFSTIKIGTPSVRSAVRMCARSRESKKRKGTEPTHTNCKTGREMNTVCGLFRFLRQIATYERGREERERKKRGIGCCVFAPLLCFCSFAWEKTGL